MKFKPERSKGIPCKAFNCGGYDENFAQFCKYQNKTGDPAPSWCPNYFPNGVELLKSDEAKAESGLMNLLNDMYCFHEWPRYKKPCETCLFKMTPLQGPYCRKCIHAKHTTPEARRSAEMGEKPMDKSKNQKTDEAPAESAGVPLLCPACGSNASKVLYSGIPAKLCMNRRCNTLWGSWSEIITWLPFNGMFIFYKGSYLKALWYFLMNKAQYR